MSSDSLFIRFYLDEDFHPDLAAALRQHGFDCESAAEARMLHKTDEEQLEYAAGQGRCLVSFNVGDFMDLASQWGKSGKHHAGILVTPQVSRQAFGSLLRRLLGILNTITADEICDVIRYF